MKILSKILSNKIFQNFFLLSFSQGINLLFPLLITPYLIRTIGFEKFGLLSIIQSISSYFFIFVDYGFNITSMRIISKNRNNKEVLSKIVFGTVITKLFLLLLSLPVFYIFCYYLLKSDNSFFLIASSFTIIVGQAILPIWFFQGLDKVKFLVLINFISKITTLIFVFSFIQKTDDYIRINLILGVISILFNSLLLFYGILRYCSFKDNILSFNVLLLNLREGWYTFKGNLSINIYTNSGVLILAFIGINKNEIGFFSAIEKIIQAIKIPIGMYLQSSYPHFFSLSEKTSPTNFFRQYMIKPYTFFLIFTLFLTFIIYYFTEQIVFYMTGNLEYKIIESVYIISVLPLSVLVFNVPHYQLYLIYGHDKKVSNILQNCSLLGIVILSVLSFTWKIRGLSIGIVITEIIVGVAITISFHKTHRSIIYVKLQNMWKQSFIHKKNRRIQKK